MVEIITLVLVFALLVYREICFKMERKEWLNERSKLLDRVQAGTLMEFKAQERAEGTKMKKREKTPLDKAAYL